VLEIKLPSGTLPPAAAVGTTPAGPVAVKARMIVAARHLALPAQPVPGEETG
jgi:hypothetical protein